MKNWIKANFRSRNYKKWPGKYKKELWEMKYKSVEIKNKMDGLNSRLEKMNKSEGKLKGII